MQIGKSSYPSEGKVYSYGWRFEGIVPLLSKYRPDSGEKAPVLLDPYENFGHMLRVCAKLGWQYFGRVATQKIEEFVTNNWALHIQKVLNDPDQVRV